MSHIQSDPVVLNILGNHVYFSHVKVLLSLGLQQCLETCKGEEQADRELK